MTSTPEQIRSEIEATRAQLGYDLDQLNDRVNPQKVAGRTAEDLKHKISEAGDALRPKVAAATGRARDTAGQAAEVAQRQIEAHPRVEMTITKTRDTAGGAMARGKAKARENPWAATGAIAMIVVVMFIIRQRRRSDC